MQAIIDRPRFMNDFVGDFSMAKTPKKDPEVVVSGPMAWVAEKLGIPPWGQLVIVLLFLIITTASVLIVKGYLNIDNKIGLNNQSMGDRVGLIENRMSNIEGQLRVLLAGRKISEISRYSKSDNVSKVTASANEVKSLLHEAANKRIPAPDDYFKESISSLDTVAVARKPEILKATQQARIALAEYRSALQPVPEISKALRNIPVGPGIITPNMVGQRAVYRVAGNLNLHPNIDLLSDGAVLNGSEIPIGTNLLNPRSTSISVNNNRVIGLIIIARQQVIDGIKWQNVTFVNTHIVYTGGDLHLENVKFVNCTFEAPATKTGIMLVDYIALGRSSLSS